jgi:CheY-like chemotaxis protein
LIEVNDDARETLADALSQFHHDVQTAPDGLAGLDLVLAKHPDVALVDIGLPGIDGYEVARQVRARMNGNSPRLIAMTGYGQPDDRQRAADAGFDMHIVKPVSLKNLRKVLSSIEPH